MGRQNFIYIGSLEKLKLTTLEDRRTTQSYNFAKRATLNRKTNKMFPNRKEKRENKRRFTKKYHVNKAKTKRYQQSAIPFLQKLLNKNED